MIFIIEKKINITCGSYVLYRKFAVFYLIYFIGNTLNSALVND